MRALRLVPLVVLTLLAALSAGGTSAGLGFEFTVNSAGDGMDINLLDATCDGDMAAGFQCTLRAAIEESNDEPSQDLISFNLGDGGLETIQPLTALPIITDTVTIDGTTQPDCSAPPCIEIDGEMIAGSASGLTLAGAGIVVRGLIINDFSGSGIAISSVGTDNVVEGNYVGTDPTGLLDRGNDLDGIIVNGAGNTIGGTDASDRNIVAGNFANGIELNGLTVSNNVIAGNYVGLGSDGVTVLGNGFSGVLLQTVTSGPGRIAGAGTMQGVDNVVGPGNVISGNGNSGVCFCSANSSTVIGNLIGTDASGSTAVPNGLDGVSLLTVAGNNQIGGTSAQDRNVISGNSRDGIRVSLIEDNAGNNIQGNYVGTSASASTVIANAGDGIAILFTEDTLIGGAQNGARNVVSGNGGYGILVNDSPGTRVIGNYVGTAASGEGDLGNVSDGIRLIADGTVGSIVRSNVSSGNGAVGISVYSEATGNVLAANQVGVTASGSPLGNDGDGVLIHGASGNQVGGVEADANTIAFNGAAGVRVSGKEFVATENPIRRNGIHSNTDLGIDNTQAGNNELPPPVLLAGPTAITGTACPNCVIDVFSDDEDEGRVYEGTTVADGGGNFGFSEPVVGPFTTATATDGDGNTSEFAAPVVSPEPPTPTPTAEPTATATAEPSMTPTPTGTPSPSETPGTTTPTATPAPGARQGDTDCDKDADSVDALFVLRDVAGFAPSKCIENGDVDCDEDRDSVDALGILRYVAALPPLVQQEPCANIGEPI